MDLLAEQLAIARLGQHVGIGIDTLFIEKILADQMIAHLIGGIGEHQHNFLCAPGDAPQADGEAVAAQDREDDADGSVAEFFPHIGGNVVHRSIVPLGAGHYRLGDGDNIPLAGRKALGLLRLEHGVHHNLGEIIALTNNRGPDAPRNGANLTFQSDTSFPMRQAMAAYAR